MSRPTPTPLLIRTRFTLADLLRARRDTILSSWKTRAKQLPNATAQEALILLPAAATLLDRLAEYSKERAIAPIEPIAGSAPERVVAEIQLLRRAVHDANAREPWPVSVDDLRDFDDAVDALIIATVAGQSRDLEALRWSEARLRAMFDVCPAAMFIKDAEGRFVMANRATAMLLGGTPGQIVGRLEQELVPEHVTAAHLANDRRALESGQPIEIEESHPYQGEVRSFLSIKFPATDPNGRRLVCGIATDITDRRRTEDEQRFLAEAGQILGSSLDYERELNAVARLAATTLADACAIDIIEPARLRRLGFAPDPAKEEALQDFIAAGPAPLDSLRPMAVAIRTHASILIPVVDDETLDRFATPEPVRKAVRALGMTSIIVVPLFGRTEVLGAVGLGVNDRRYGPVDLNVAEELARIAADAIENARLYQTAQEAIRHREDVLAIVTHDLRSPLTTIRVATQALLGSSVDELCARHLQVVGRATQRMERLIGDLLEATAIRTGHMVVIPKPERVSTLLAEAIDAQNGTAKQRGIRVVRAFDAEPIEVSCDRDRVLQVLSNLVGNALKFCREGDTISVGVDVGEREVRIFVSDTGPGIEQDDLARLFDPYWSARHHEGKGTGLGLYISKGLVEAHGGRIGVESLAGQGTTFWFTLPRA